MRRVGVFFHTPGRVCCIGRGIDGVRTSCVNVPGTLGRHSFGPHCWSNCHVTTDGVWFESFLHRCTTSLQSTTCWHSQYCHILDF